MDKEVKQATRILVEYYKALNSSQGRLVRCLGLKVFAKEWKKNRKASLPGE